MNNYPNTVINLVTCSDEPLEKIGRIQGHGVLFIIDSLSDSILQVSDNIQTRLGIEEDCMLSQVFWSIFPINQQKHVKKWLKHASHFELLELELSENRWQFTKQVAVETQLIIIQAERKGTKASDGFMMESFNAMETAMTLQLLYQTFTDALLQLTDYERVLLMEFKQNWQGEVSCESLADPSIPSFINYHFPPQDIPEQVREMLKNSSYRYIPNVNGDTATISPYINPLTEEPTSLLNITLRNPSELHTEYLKNMEVVSSFILSVVVDGKLWGIVACHGFDQKEISLDKRNQAVILLKYFCSQFKVEREEVNEQLTDIFADARQGLLAQMAKNYDIWTGLTQGEYALTDLNNSEGVAFYWHDKLHTEGKTPSEHQIRALLYWFNQEFPEKRTFYIDCLSNSFEEAKAYTKVASGALFLRIANNPKTCIVWFKPEIIREMIWAGNPENPEKRIANQPNLHPRKSFSNWVELARGYSEAWEKSEIDNVEQLEAELTNFIITANRKLEEINAKLQRTLEEKQQLIEELNVAEEEIRQTHDFQKEIIENLSTTKIGEFKTSTLEGNITHKERHKIGTLLINENYEIISQSNSANRLFKNTLILNTDFRNYLDDIEASKFEEICERTFKGEKIFKDSKRRIEGEIYWIRQYYYPVYNSRGEIYAIGCDLQDFTRRKRAEDAVHNLAMVARNTKNGVIITNNENEIIWVNYSFTQLTEYELDEVVGDRPDILLKGEETNANTLSLMKEHLQNREPFEVDIIQYKKSGEKFWVNLTVQAYTDTYGENRYFYMLVDVTNLKLVNMAIQESEEKFRLLSENAQDIIVLQEKDATISYVSPSVEHVLGYVQEEVIGKVPFEIVHPNFRREEIEKNFYQYIKEREYFREEYKVKHTNGEYIWVETSFHIVVETEQIQSITRNIDERKRAEIALDKTNQELDRFVYSVSHDLRSPIASTLGLIEVMEEEQDPSEIAQYLQLQKKSLQRLDGFISDIVDYSRNNRMEVASEKVNWEELISEIFENYNFLPESDTISKKVVVEGDSIPFFNDSLRIKIVFSNLIANAINYSNSYSIEESFVNVTVKISPQKSEITVADNGLGIKKEYQGKIFDMFYRANNQKPGSGIGLYIVKETLEKLNGTITLTSEENKGTSFFVEIPNNK